MDTTRGVVDKSGDSAKVGLKTGAKGHENADGWTWGEEHVDGLWKTSDWQKGTGSGWWTTANDWTSWESEEPMGGIEINSIERCCSKNPGRGEKQKTSESDRRRRGTPTPRPSPTPKPSRSPSESSATSEMSVSSEGSWTKSCCEMERWFSLQTEDVVVTRPRSRRSRQSWYDLGERQRSLPS